MRSPRPIPPALTLLLLGSTLISGCLEDVGSVSAGAAANPDGGAPRAPGAPPGAPSAPACEAPASQTPSELPPCCVDIGGAHCVRAANLPPGVRNVFAECAGGACMPDEFIQTGGQYAPPSCESADGAEGVCLSLCVPRVRQNRDTYPRGSCAANQRCAPCAEGGSPTGLCPIDFSCPPPPPPPPPADEPPPQPGDAPPESGGDDVKDAGTPSAPGAPPPGGSGGGSGRCCGGAGSCVSPSGVPAGVAGRLSAEGCASGQICLPDSFARGGAPASCSASIPFVGAVGGACIPECMVDLGSLGGAVVQRGSCGTGEMCVPCEIPFGGSTGLCG